MKKFTLSLLGLVMVHFTAWAQSPPFMLSHTVVPSNPTTADVIKVIRTVISPNQAIEVDKGYTVSTSAMKVFVHGCYAGSMLPATQTFVDTFSIGQLPAGVYGLEHKAYASAAQQWCNKNDSATAGGTFTVTAITALREHSAADQIQVFPNPASDQLTLSGNSVPKEVVIYAATGALIRKVYLGATKQISVADLPNGVYILRMADAQETRSLRFIKQSN